MIYVVIIGLWAAVLVPIWLRRHDKISEVRSTARFSSAMKTLGGRGEPQYASGIDDGDEYEYYATAAARMTDGRSAGRTHDTEARMGDGARDRRAVRSTWSDESSGLDPEYERELVRREAATRRTIVLGILTSILVVTLLLAVMSVLPRWVPVLAALPVVAFVLATALTASARAASGAEHRQSSRVEPMRTPAPRRTERVEDPAPAVSAQVDDWENWNAWDDDQAWDAVPTTLPTYVGAPRASSVPREIDRAHSGEWSGEAMVETARAMRGRPTAESLSRYEDIDHSADTAEIPAVQYRDARAANQ